MSSYSASAIILKKISYGDFDTIISLFTKEKGKVVVIAKAAKKSKKRFSGILELFSNLDVIYSYGKRTKGMPVLKEASIRHPFFNIRSSILRVALASYWAETLNQWMQEGESQSLIYRLFEHMLIRLDDPLCDIEHLNVLFQLKFISLSGFRPNFVNCAVCHISLESFKANPVRFSLNKGGVLCHRCQGGFKRELLLSKKTLKQLIWINSNRLDVAHRMKFSHQSIHEARKFLEAFVPYQLGFEPNSLKFLRKLRPYMVVDKKRSQV